MPVYNQDLNIYNSLDIWQLIYKFDSTKYRVIIFNDNYTLKKKTKKTSKTLTLVKKKHLKKQRTTHTTHTHTHTHTHNSIRFLKI